jgi:hypothetical protein
MSKRPTDKVEVVHHHATDALPSICERCGVGISGLLTPNLTDNVWTVRCPLLPSKCSTTKTVEHILKNAAPLSFPFLLKLDDGYTLEAWITFYQRDSSTGEGGSSTG